MKELWLCTRQYPSGRGEAFLQHAIPIWSKQFSRVVVIPMFEGEGDLPIPAGIEVVQLWKESPYASLPITETMLNAAWFVRTVGRHGPMDDRSARFIMSHSRQLLFKAEAFRDRMLKNYDPEKVAILAVWMEDWVSVLGSLKDKVPELRFSAMAHGWDLYEHRRASGNIPYRKFQMRSADKVFAVSERGVEHLHTTYPDHANKARLFHLGTPDHGPAPWTQSGTLRIVSCSYLRHPKRVDLIVKALAKVDGRVHWTHFGDGPLRPRIEALIAKLPANITVHLRGNTSNSEVLDHYKQNEVDLFVHFSESEGGVPLAIQEATSFGIPVIGNDVGGIGELVNERTGVLLPAAPKVDEIAKLLLLEGASAFLNSTFRSGVRAFWKQRFHASTNYRALGEQL